MSVGENTKPTAHTRQAIIELMREMYPESISSIADAVLALPAIRQALARSQAIDDAEVGDPKWESWVRVDDVYYKRALSVMQALRSIDGTP